MAEKPHIIDESRITVERSPRLLSLEEMVGVGKSAVIEYSERNHNVERSRTTFIEMGSKEFPLLLVAVPTYESALRKSGGPRSTYFGFVFFVTMTGEVVQLWPKI